MISQQPLGLKRQNILSVEEHTMMMMIEIFHLNAFFFLLVKSYGVRGIYVHIKQVRELNNR